MKILVTGGAGFIGSNLIEFFLEKGHEVVCVDNESAQTNEKFYWNKSTTNYKLDICDKEKIFPLFKGVDCVFHLAAESRIGPCIEDPLKAVKTNVLGTTILLECARKNNIKRFVYSSTSACYGIKNSPPLTEDMPLDNLNPYSFTKISGENMCEMYAKMYGMETIILRYFNVYGKNQPLKGQYAPVVGIFMRQIKNNEPMTIVGDGEQRRDFINVKDIVKANYLASNFKPKNNYEWGQIYNVGCGKNYSINEISKMLGKDKIHIPPRIGEARHTLADYKKIKNDLNWEPTIDLSDWINSNKK